MTNGASPDSLESLAWLLRDRHGAKRPVALRGGSTHSDAAMHPREQIDLHALRGVVAYEPEDLTITVLAGTPWTELQTMLSSHRQWLPVEPPISDRSTVGGIVAGGFTGASRLRYGPLRDHVIAAQFIPPDGSIVRSGSRVVKSVAGYDLHKMLVGSRGTLCAIGEITFKVAPRPAAQMIIACPWSATSIETITRLITTSSPAFAVLISAPLVRAAHLGDAPMVVMRWDGHDLDIDATDATHPLPGPVCRQGDADFRRWNDLVRQWNLGRTDIVRVTGSASALLTLFDTAGPSHDAVCDIASGVMDIDAPHHAIRVPQAARMSISMLYRNAPVGGVLSGPGPTEQRLAASLKQTFDPHDILESWLYYASSSV